MVEYTEYFSISMNTFPLEEKAQMLLLLSTETAFDLYTKDILRDYIVLATDSTALLHLKKQLETLKKVKAEEYKKVTASIAQILKVEAEPIMKNLANDERKKAESLAEDILSTYSIN